MTRVTTTLLIFLVLMNGAVGIMSSSGLQDDLGVALAPGVTDSVDSAVNTAKDGFTANSGFADTLIALILSALKLFSALIQSVFALPKMLINLGIPSWIVVPVSLPLYIIAALEFVFLATGRDML